MNSFEELVLKRYSCRDYQTRAVDRALVNQIVETAHFAPSATNAQPWRIYVIDSQENLAKVRSAYHREWFNAAPVVLMLCALKDKAWTRADGKNHANIDVAILADHLTLAAADKGLGTCWVCNFDAEMLTKEFGLSADCEPVVLLPMGYAANDEIPAKKRKSLSEIVEYQ